jgi:pSer/pThr/pTyr-binding forkhead associated (FHA) protein
LWWLRRRRAAKKLDAEGPDPADSSDASASDPDFSFIEYAELLPVEEKDGPPLRIEGDSMTIGSQGSDMDIVIEDASVGRLHARLKRQGRAYWLFDEGSPEGTYINYDRLGLAPRELTDGDLLQFGTVRFSFRVRKLMEKENE